MAKRNIANELLEGLNDALEFEKGNKDLKTTFKELPGPAPKYSKSAIRKIRKDFGLNQEEFAQLLNVEITTIRSWEQGQRSPNKAAERLIQLFEADQTIIQKIV